MVHERSAVKNAFSTYVWSKVDSCFCEFLYVRITIFRTQNVNELNMTEIYEKASYIMHRDFEISYLPEPDNRMSQEMIVKKFFSENI